MTATKTFEIASRKTALEIIESLRDIKHFSLAENQVSDNHAYTKVGSEFMFRMLGAGIYNNYTAPVKVDVQTNGKIAHVELTPATHINILIKPRVDDFFNRTFNEIEDKIRAAA